MMIINGKQVIEINKRQLSYRDANGELQFIDLKQCYLNYLQQHLSLAAFESYKQLNGASNKDLIAYTSRVIEWKEVGHRNSLGGAGSGTDLPPNEAYIKFHTKPVSFIVFDKEDELWDFHMRFVKTGWHLWDMT
jgi:hypothetical protein